MDKFLYKMVCGLSAIIALYGVFGIWAYISSLRFKIKMNDIIEQFRNDLSSFREPEMTIDDAEIMAARAWILALHNTMSGASVDSFEGIAELSDNDIIEILKRTEHTRLAISLVDTHTNIQETFYKGMSRRAQELIQEDVERFTAMKS